MVLELNSSTQGKGGNIMKDELLPIKKFFSDKLYVRYAIAYGTLVETGVDADLDICLILDSKVSFSSEDFMKLTQYRNSLVKELNKDIDLIPHSLDELDFEVLTPLTYPWNNPSLVHGEILKGDLSIPQSINIENKKFTQTDVAKYHLLLDRTLIRRSVCREGDSLDEDVFFNKIKQLPYNIVNYLSTASGEKCLKLDPNNYEENLKLLRLICEIKDTDKLAFSFKKASFQTMTINKQNKFKCSVGQFVDELIETALSQDLSQLRFNVKKTTLPQIKR